MNNKDFEQAAEKKYPLHDIDSEIPCISVNDIVREYRQVFIEGCEHAAPKWIDVKERLPLYGQRVLTYNPTNEISDEEVRTIMYGSVGRGFPQSVTHWQELPSSPPSIQKLNPEKK
jgi:hypothetical protein